VRTTAGRAGAAARARVPSGRHLTGRPPSSPGDEGGPLGGSPAAPHTPDHHGIGAETPLEAGERGGRPGVGGRGAPKKPGWGRASLGPSPSSPSRRARPGSRTPPAPLPALATRWQVTASERSVRRRAGRQRGELAERVDPEALEVTPRSGRRRTDTDHGARNSAVAPFETMREVRAARMPANSPSAMPTCTSPARGPRRGRRQAARRGEPHPEEAAGARAGTVQMPRRTGLTHGQNRSTAAMTSRNALGSSPAPLVEQRRAPHHHETVHGSSTPVAIGRRRHGRRMQRRGARGHPGGADRRPPPRHGARTGTRARTRSPPRSTRAPGAPRRAPRASGAGGPRRPPARRCGHGHASRDGVPG